MQVYEILKQPKNERDPYDLAVLAKRFKHLAFFRELKLTNKELFTVLSAMYIQEFAAG